jgi:integrase
MLKPMISGLLIALNGFMTGKNWSDGYSKRYSGKCGTQVVLSIFHALRHAAGSLIARHADARFVQEFLGHSRITTTERYMHAKARPEDVERVNLAFALPTTSESERS